MATFTNSATLSYNGNMTVSNTVTGTLQEVLVVTKTPVVPDYTSRGEVTYVITLVNSGTTALTGLILTDNLGAFSYNEETRYPLTYTENSVKYYINGLLQAAPTVTAGPPLEIRGINIPAGGNATLIYEARANEFAPMELESFITNQVTVTGDNLAEPVTAEATVNAETAPVLTIHKALSPTTVASNGEISYTFTIQNTGNAAADAAAGIVLTDTFDPILDPITVTFNGTAWAAPANYTYDTATGVFSTVAGQITVPAATYTRDPATGAWITTPGVSTLVITGTV